MKVSQRIINEIIQCGISVSEPEHSKMPTIILKNTKSDVSVGYYKKFKRNTLFLETDIDRNYQKVIDDICECSVYKFKNVVLSERLLHLKNQLDKTNLRKSSSFKEILQDIRELGFIVGKDYIIWDKLIPVEIMIYKSQMIDCEGIEFKSLFGIGITKLRIEISDKIYTIEAMGDHPHSTYSDEYQGRYFNFCVDLSDHNDVLNVDSLLSIINTMRTINLDHCYRKDHYMDMFIRYFHQMKKD